MTTRIKLRRDTAANWTSANPVLALGEPGYDTTNNKLKVGNGTSTWAQLSYLTDATGTVGATVLDELTDVVITGTPTNGQVLKYDTATSKWVNGSDSTGSSGLSITDFGEGFSLNNDDKIVTNKLFSADVTQPTQRYRLELTTTGVVVLPDQSIINGATLKTVPGNYAGITAGPASPAGKDEDSWVWVDNNGATIATKYSTDAHTWTFNNDGDLTLPVGGDIKDSAGNSVLGSADTGDITFENNKIIADPDAVFQLESKDDNNVVRAYLRLDPGNGLAEMRARGNYRSASFSSGGWTTAQWTGSGGTGQVAFTGANELQTFLNDSLGGAVNITVSINNGEFFAYDGWSGGSGNFNFFTTASPPASPTTVTSIDFRYYRESRIQIDNDDDEITIYGDGLDVNIESTTSIRLESSEATVVGSEYAQIESNNNYVWVDNTGAHIEIDGGGDFKFEFVDDTARLRLPPGADIVDSSGNSVLGGGEGLPTVTVPAETGTDYKGLQVSYGGFHSYPGNTSKRNVTKVVIHKPAATTTTITDDSDSDFFQVSGIGSSDILAMFVVVGDVNEAKPLSDITAFAEAVIDNVILDGGVEGEFRTVDEMKTAFYGNFQPLLASVGGVASNFEFFESNINVLNAGPTTVREGSGAIFEIQDLGDGTYNSSEVISGGINYLPGHKIKILGSALGGVDGVNDCIITVNSVDSEGISGRSVEGVAAGTVLATYGPVTGTNYNVGNGFSVAVVYKYENYVGISSYGTNYVVGDVITLLGANITGGTTPANNITITVNSIGGLGEAYGSTSSGTAPVVWRNNNISDGGEDEYDSGNYINSSYLNEIAYNGGNTVVDGAAAFGTGSSYSFVYQDSIFGLFVTGNSSTTIGTSGSGPDSGSAIISGNIYGPNIAAQTFDNAVSHINIIGGPYAGPLITFTRTDYGDEIDEISEGLHITKDDQGWLYNALEDDGDGDNTPTGSLWNNDGWDDFINVESRTYTSLSDIWYGNFANIPGAKMIMLDTTTGKYWAVEFLSWTNGGNGGGASYTRRELDLDSLETGIRFRDGTRLTSAEGIGRVKLRSPGERRIEEVYGYKQVSVTERTTGNTVTTTAFSNNSNNTGYVGLSAVGAARDALIALANGNVYYRVQVSLNEADWATGRVDDWGSNNVGIYFDNGVRLAVAQGDTVYYRILTGGAPVTWWDKDDLPSGSGNFRGAIIKYHAYTGDATWIGTIHIVDDDGEEHITHTEVQSGNEDGENDDLWFVPTEGEIQYRRTDGEDATLKIQWTATVFYGSEYNDD